MNIFEEPTYWKPPNLAVIKALAIATLVAGLIAYAGASIGILTRADFQHENGISHLILAPMVVFIARLYTDSKTDLLITGVVCLLFALAYKATPHIHETGLYSSSGAMWFALPAALVTSIASVKPVDDESRARRQGLILGLCANLCLLSFLAFFAAVENGLFE